VTAIEYGVRYRWKHGGEFIAGGYTEGGAKLRLERASGRGFDPKAVQIMCRPAVDWQPYKVDQDRDTTE